MHDLIHDLAQEVAGKETLVLDSPKSQIDRRIRHLSLTKEGRNPLVDLTAHLSEMKTLCTFLRVSVPYENVLWLNVIAICSHLRRLRILDLHGSTFNTLPDTIGTLLHLRYLDLSWNSRLKVLPNSITKLHNLQILILDHSRVTELPRDMRKLASLRHLSLNDCVWLTHMPAGLNKLTSLHTLTQFVVGNEISNQDHNHHVGKLRDLEALVNLRGEFSIIFKYNSSCKEANYTKLELLRTLQLANLKVEFCKEGTFHELLLACLQPHATLKQIDICWYNDFKLPIWTESLTTSLPCLVKIKLRGFYTLEILPSLSQLRHLKYLKLEGMSNVEFMESDVVVGPFGVLFFPSLVYLRLIEFPKLKGWWREEIRRVTGEAGASSAVVPSFPCLRDVGLYNCPSLTVFPPCPNLKSLQLKRVNEALTFLGSTAVVSSHPNIGICLESLSIDKLEGFDCLFGESLGKIYWLQILKFMGESLSGVPEKYVTQASIEGLDIRYCNNLKSLSGIEHLTSLHSLDIARCDNLDLEYNEHGVTPWKSLQILTSLYLSGLPKLSNLPMEFQNLASLKILKISNCENLEALPEWLDCLTSLQTLSLSDCSKLKLLPEPIAQMPSLIYLHIYKCRNLSNSCREPDGEDWPKIRHIPRLRVELE